MPGERPEQKDIQQVFEGLSEGSDYVVRKFIKDLLDKKSCRIRFTNEGLEDARVIVNKLLESKDILELTEYKGFSVKFSESTVEFEFISEEDVK